MEKFQEAVGRVFEARVELDKTQRVVHLRNSALNAKLKPLWGGGAGKVFVKVVKLSDATAKEGVAATVTVAFSRDVEWLETQMSLATMSEAEVVWDLTEKQLNALGLEYADGRWWTPAERAAATVVEIH